MTVSLAASEWGTFEGAVRWTWLEATGLGPYAASSLPGLREEEQQGLYCLHDEAQAPGRTLVAGTEEWLFLEHHEIALSTVTGPQGEGSEGFRCLEAFRLDPWPTWEYRLDRVLVRRELCMPHGHRLVLLCFSIQGGEGRLRITPLLSYARAGETPPADWLEAGLWVEPHGRARYMPGYGLPDLCFGGSVRRIGCQPLWYSSVPLLHGRAPGEELYAPGCFELQLAPGRRAFLGIGEEYLEEEAEQVLERERRRRERLGAGQQDPVRRLVLQTADTFLVGPSRRRERVIAAYPRGGSEGDLDGLLALTGLTLATQRFSTFRQVLTRMIRRRSQEEDPPGAGWILWLAVAMERYLALTGDGEFLRASVWPSLHDWMTALIVGGVPGVRVDSRGLLLHAAPLRNTLPGGASLQPRPPGAVELQALWYHGLRTMEHMALTERELSLRDFYRGIADPLQAAFNQRYWCEERGCLADGVSEQGRATEVRPFQILALSLSADLVPPDRAQRILDTVERELLTQVGLRSLSPAEDGYLGRGKNSSGRGGAWPWLLGPFVSAMVRVRGRGSDTRERMDRIYRDMRDRALQDGLGGWAAWYEGDPPHRIQGRPWHATAVGELVRSFVEDFLQGELPTGKGKGS